MTADKPLAGLQVVEHATFVAGPSAGLTLAQLGAHVIRIDPPGGGSDRHRWPVAADGTSIYWAALNRGKRSVVIDHRTPRGRELVRQLVATGGAGGGIYLDNMVGRSRFHRDELAAERPDVITVHIQGHADGRPAVDYTVNAEIGVAAMTGPAGERAPVNHVLPAWDLLAGLHAALAITAAVRRRDHTGAGGSVDLPLADVAVAAVGTLGWLADADRTGVARPPVGNDVYGTYGSDFGTADGHRVMVMALTAAQWHGLTELTGTTAAFAALERALGLDLTAEGERYRHRELIGAVLRPWFAARDLAEVGRSLTAAHVVWGPFLEMAQAAARVAARTDGFVARLDQAGIGPMLSAGNPLRWDRAADGPAAAPTFGADTERVLAETLHLTTAQIGALVRDGVVGG